MTLLDRQKEFTIFLTVGFRDLELKGLPLISSCAITGNASQENLVNPVTNGPKDHGSDGVLQWRLDRLDGSRGLKGWAQAHGLPWDTLKTQAAFTLWELESDPRYSTLLKDLRDGKKKIETLTANFCFIYERPNKALAHLDKRISHAASVYKIMRAALPIVVKPEPAPKSPPSPRPVPAPAAPTWGDRLKDFLDKLGTQPPARAPLPSPPSPRPVPIPAPTATPTPDLLSVANRIEARQNEMFQMLEDKFVAFDAKLDAIKLRVDDLHAQLAAKDAALAAAVGVLTPEQQGELDALNAHADAITNKLDALAAS